MRLNRMTLSNFKGVTAFELRPGGANAAVFGDNGTGKTTLADAFCWALTGKDTTGSKLNPKPLDIRGAEVHNLESAVEAELVDETTGALTTLRRAQTENWTGRRGHAKEYTGNSTAYVVNGVPVQEKDYLDQVAAICPPDVAQMLTDPDALPGKLHWQKRRAILLEVCGDVSAEDVVAANKALAPILDILANQAPVAGKTPLEARRAVVDSRRKEGLARQKELPARIDEVAKSIAHIVWEDAAQDETKVAELDTERDQLNQDRARAQAGAPTQGLQRELQAAEERVREAKRQVDEAARAARHAEEDRIRAACQELVDKVSEAKTTLLTAERNLQAAKDALAGAKRGQAALEAELIPLRNQRDALKDAVWEGDTSCPTCRRPLPEEQVEAARAAFNERRATELERVRAAGTAKRADLNACIERADECERALPPLEDARQQAEAALAEAEVALQGAEPMPTTWPAPDYNSSQAVAAALAEVADISQRINESDDGGMAGELARIDARLSTISRERQECATRISQAKQRQGGEARIAELETEQRAIGEQLELLEQEIHLMERFTRAKAALLTDRVNAAFGLARVRIFRELVNGGLEDCCDITYNGVPYGGGLNTGSRLNVGLDIIRTLSRHYGVTLPVFADNGESVTRLIEIPSQVIRLVVEAGARELRVDTAAPQADLFASNNQAA